jgi:hypothetical protein
MVIVFKIVHKCTAFCHHGNSEKKFFTDAAILVLVNFVLLPPNLQKINGKQKRQASGKKSG